VGLVTLLACGGNSQPAPNVPDTPPAVAGTSAAPPATATTEAPAASATSTPAGPADSAAATPASPPPTLAGKIGGVDFVAKVAQTAGPIMKDGRVLVAIADYSASCTTAHTSAAGEHTLGLMVPWKVGSVDFAKTMKPPKKGQMPDAFFNTVGADGKLAGVPYKATGTIEVVSVPGADKPVGHLKFDLKSGTDTMKGEIDVSDCGFGTVSK